MGYILHQCDGQQLIQARQMQGRSGPLRNARGTQDMLRPSFWTVPRIKS